MEDILSSTKKLRVLGTAFTVIPLSSGRYLVQSIPGELSQDQVSSVQPLVGCLEICHKNSKYRYSEQDDNI